MTNTSNFKNVITFLNGFIIPGDLKSVSDKSLTMGFQIELMARGYMLSEELYNDLLSSDVIHVKSLYVSILTYIDEHMGNGNFKPLFDGFPVSVMNMSDMEFYENQLLHYFSNGTFIPSIEPIKNKIEFERPNYIIINKGSNDDFCNIFTKLCASTVALTPQDQSIFDFFINHYASDLRLPTEIPMKEMACKLIDLNIYVPKTVTDVLRYAVFLSGGDISLPALPPKMIKESTWSSRKIPNTERNNFKFKKFSRPERKKILYLLEKTNMDVREMKLRIGSWIRLGEILHPGQYAKQYPFAFDMFNRLRNEKIQSWYGKLEEAKSKGLETYLSVIKERPGEFARRLDYCLRTYTNNNILILEEFSKIANKISNKVLFELYNHFCKRSVENGNRTVFIKGAKKPVNLPTLPPMSDLIVKTVCDAIIENIKSNLGNKESFNKQLFYVSDNLKNMPLPLGMRTVSNGLKQVPRGTKIPFDLDKDTFRFYTHWEDENGKEDLDLSARLVKEDFNQSYNISWNNSRNLSEIALFSGDVRHRRGNCAEYIDVNVKKALALDYRYCVVDVNNYEGRSFDSVNSFAGWMTLKHPHANTTWLPSNVSHSFALTSKNSNICCAIIDFKEQYIIVVDESYDGLPVSSYSQNTKPIIERYTNPSYLSVYDIIKWNIDARNGILITDELLSTLSEEAKNETLNRSTMYDFKYFYDDYKRILELM